MSTSLQDEARKKLAEYEGLVSGELGFMGKAAKAVMNHGVPFLGELYFFIVRDVIGPPPSWLEYMEELRKVIRGERFTMPYEPRHTMRDHGR